MLTLFIILWIVFAFVIPSVFSWMNVPLFSRYFDGFEMNAVKGYWGYFFLGYYIKCCNWNKIKRMIFYWGGITSLGFTIFFTLYQSISENQYVEKWFSPGSPFVLCMSIAVFLMFFMMKYNENSRAYTIITKVSESTFFIYMFHVFILEKLNLIGITTVSINALISVPLLTIIAFACSYFIAVIVKRIPIIGRILLYK